MDTLLYCVTVIHYMVTSALRARPVNTCSPALGLNRESRNIHLRRGFMGLKDVTVHFILHYKPNNDKNKR